MGKGGKAPAYTSTTSSNPYATGTNTSKGSSYTLNPYMSGANQFIESNMPGLYNQLINPSLANPVTKARSDLFYNQFNKDSSKAFENNLINPLAQRGMLRSSAMNDLSNSFANSQNEQISNFNNQLIANNTADTNAIINQLMNLYTTHANLGQQALANARGDAQLVNNYNMQGYQQESANNNAMWGNLANLGGSLFTGGGSALGGYLKGK